MKYTITLSVLTALVVIGGAVSLIQRSNVQQTQVPEAVSSRAYRDFWITRMQDEGASAAYELFKTDNQDRSTGTRHLAAHVIGDVLYETQGIDGVTVCDSAFGFGCFHGFFGVALASEGVDAVSALNDSCVERYGPLGTGCTHGIGHGILEYMGYDRVNEALAMCDETTQVVPILGCSSGVFMEYNTPLRETEDGGLITRPREITQENIMGGCSAVLERYKPSCYFELGAWWTLAMDKDWQRMARLCEQVTNTTHRNMCAMGVGYSIVAIHTKRVSRAASICDAFENGLHTFCRAGVHWGVRSIQPQSDTPAVQACQGANVDTQTCTQWGKPDTWVDSGLPL